MYFSRVRIRPNIFKSSQLGKVLEGNVYGIHRLLWDLFPEQQQRTFLYREEIARENVTKAELDRIVTHLDHRFSKLESKIDELIKQHHAQ